MAESPKFPSVPYENEKTVSVIMDSAMGHIPRSTEHTSSFLNKYLSQKWTDFYGTQLCWHGVCCVAPRTSVHVCAPCCGYPAFAVHYICDLGMLLAVMWHETRVSRPLLHWMLPVQRIARGECFLSATTLCYSQPSLSSSNSVLPKHSRHVIWTSYHLDDCLMDEWCIVICVAGCTAYCNPGTHWILFSHSLALMEGILFSLVDFWCLYPQWDWSSLYIYSDATLTPICRLWLV